MEPLLEQQIKIREATRDDVPAIRTLHAKSWQDVYPNEEAGVSRRWVMQKTENWLTPENLEKSKNFLGELFASPNIWYRIATLNDEVIAMACGSKKERQYVEALYVHKLYHGTGLAQRLMDSMMDWFDRAKPVSLDVATYNDRAINFYEKYGFEKVDGSEHLYKEVMPAVEMVRKGDNDEV